MLFFSASHASRCACAPALSSSSAIMRASLKGGMYAPPALAAGWAERGWTRVRAGAGISGAAGRSQAGSSARRAAPRRRPPLTRDGRLALARCGGLAVALATGRRLGARARLAAVPAAAAARGALAVDRGRHVPPVPVVLDVAAVGHVQLRDAAAARPRRVAVAGAGANAQRRALAAAAARAGRAGGLVAATAAAAAAAAPAAPRHELIQAAVARVVAPRPRAAAAAAALVAHARAAAAARAVAAGAAAAAAPTARAAAAAGAGAAAPAGVRGGARLGEGCRGHRVRTPLLHGPHRRHPAGGRPPPHATVAAAPRTARTGGRPRPGAAARAAARPRSEQRRREPPRAARTRADPPHLLGRPSSPDPTRLRCLGGDSGLPEPRGLRGRGVAGGRSGGEPRGPPEGGRIAWGRPWLGPGAPAGRQGAQRLAQIAPGLTGAAASGSRPRSPWVRLAGGWAPARGAPPAAGAIRKGSAVRSVSGKRVWWGRGFPQTGTLSCKRLRRAATPLTPPAPPPGVAASRPVPPGRRPRPHWPAGGMLGAPGGRAGAAGGRRARSGGAAPRGGAPRARAPRAAPPCPGSGPRPRRAPPRAAALPGGGDDDAPPDRREAVRLLRRMFYAQGAAWRVWRGRG
jgi:hypothetical protein